eukprot:TRINITY_DN69150_c0_g1_i1.p1 TRINITY_DN69150_c0_g1~~TRINITY_DN69150_c0_g1_i1.p1  ORF type:complete len:108 (+),score=1.28 TRINITY_DN69150_c0_g1_i1:56-379(+)
MDRQLTLRSLAQNSGVRPPRKPPGETRKCSTCSTQITSPNTEKSSQMSLLSSLAAFHDVILITYRRTAHGLARAVPTFRTNTRRCAAAFVKTRRFARLRRPATDTKL